MTYRDTMSDVAEAVSVRLDQESMRALRKLQATGLSQSEAIRRALFDSANALGHARRISAEMSALEVDENDRAEMLHVAELMEALREPR